jgi:pilus assembly protein CpaC
MKHFVRSTLVALSLFAVPVFANPSQQPTPAEAQGTITLKVGETQDLQVPGLTRLALGNIEFAEVKAEGKEIVRIEGRKAGETTLLVWSGKNRKAYRLVVQG